MCQPAHLILLALLFVAKYTSACPESCVCKWKNGKQTVECISKNMIVFPDGMDSGTQVFNFNHNNIQRLAHEIFVNKNVTNLQRIYLSHCHISTIEDRCFKGLTNLVELDLSNNVIEYTSTDTFRYCPSLMRLLLNNNLLRVIKREAFNHLGFLNTLELSHNEIAAIEEGAFHGLQNLEWLYLDHNQLSTIEGSSYLPAVLKGVNLQDNPWLCDCNMRELQMYLKRLGIPHFNEPLCEQPPRLKGLKLTAVKSNDLACLPFISPTTLYLEIREGKNISLLCHIKAFPEATVSWWFQGQLLQNDTAIKPGVHLLYYVEEGTMEKRSELFIFNTNTEDNGTFVCHAENPAGITQANYTIKVIVKHEYDPPKDTGINLVLLIVAIITVFMLVLIPVLVVLIIGKFRRIEEREKRTRGQQSVQNNLANKESLMETTNNIFIPKEINIINFENQQLYSSTPKSNLESVASPALVLPNKNPDLVQTKTVSFYEAGTMTGGDPSTASPQVIMNLPDDLTVNDCNFFVYSEAYNKNVLTANPNQCCPLPYKFGAPLPVSQSTGDQRHFYSTMRRPAVKNVQQQTQFKRSSSWDNFFSENLRYTANGYPE